MRSTMRAALVAALASLPLAAAAQGLQGFEPDPTLGAPLDGGQPVPLEPAPAANALEGVPSLRASHGDWEVRCLGEADCVMTQLHRRTPETADAVFTIVKPRDLTDRDGRPMEAFAEIVVPLGVYLPGGLGLKVDDAPARAAPYERCIDEGCVVRAPISPEMVAAMKAGRTATVVIFGAPDQPVQIPISLIGFTAAYDAF